MGIKTAGALALIFVAWVIAAWVGRIVARRLERVQFDLTLTRFFASVTRYTILVMALLACLSIFGVQTTSFAAVIGAAGLAVGLAMQGTLSNFAAGIMMLVFRPFTIGDVVEAGGVRGKITAIELFTTTFDTPDNRRFIVPNSLIFGATIENVTYHATRRVDVSVGADYGADIDATRAVLEKAVASVPGRIEEPAAQVFLQQLGGSSVDWQVRVWCNTEDYWDVYQATVRAVKREMDAASIGIPFPQMDVHLDGTLESR
jgi:small conductance mechanosensitive channel